MLTALGVPSKAYLAFAKVVPSYSAYISSHSALLIQAAYNVLPDEPTVYGATAGSPENEEFSNHPIKWYPLLVGVGSEFIVGPVKLEHELPPFDTNVTLYCPLEEPFSIQYAYNVLPDEPTVYGAVTGLPEKDGFSYQPPN